MTTSNIKKPQVLVLPNEPKTSGKLLDNVRSTLKIKHYSLSTERVYIFWIRRFIFFHQKKHPAQMGAPEISSFLSHLAVKESVSSSTQNQALSALVFLYKHVLGLDPGQFKGLIWAKRPGFLPVVLTKNEINAVLDQLHDVPLLVVSLLYGAGLRLRECLALRIKDIDFENNSITIKQGKHHKDRLVMLPQQLKIQLQNHLSLVRALHKTDLEAGFGSVDLPFALSRKYPHAAKTWKWQYVFPGNSVTNLTRVVLFDITYMKVQFSAPFPAPCKQPELTSMLVATPAVTALQRIYLRTVSISDEFSSYSGIQVLRLQ